MGSELVSVIILSYINFDGIYFTLDSIFNQTYPDIEIVISDDGSPNYAENIDRIKKYIEINRGSNIKNVIYNEISQNSGTVKNINSAIVQSTGKYIKLISVDDGLSRNDALEIYVDFLANSKYEICFAKMRGVQPNGKYLYKLASCEDDYDELRRLSPDKTKNKLFGKNFLPAPALCVKRTLFDKYGLFHETTRLIEDYSYWIYLCSQDVRFGYIDDILIDYKLSGISSAGSYGVSFLKDLFVIYDQYIFPHDKRYGAFQPIYNLLKKAGLATYMAKANWKNYSFYQKVVASIKYAPFFLYIWVGNKKVEQQNRKIKNEL
ncbi:MAG: glycosyltransferase [Lachnospiraceae bacterium]|nr:glycosyltransferase [Lachnospiraceae bacterium]